MRFEDLSRAHWIVVAILIGAAMAWLHTSWGRANMTQSHSQTEFEMIFRSPVKGTDGQEFPWVRGVTIYPPVDAGFTIRSRDGNEVRPRKSVVTYRVLSPSPDRKGWMYSDATTLVDDPFKPVGRPPTSSSVLAVLKEAGQTRPWMKYRYAWWVEPRFAYPLWIGSLFVVVGLVWPSVLNRMVQAGYGRKSDREARKGPSFLKQLFTRSSKPAEPAQAHRSATDLSEAELARIAQMEQDLRGFMNKDDKEIGGEVDESAPIRQLNAEPATAPPPEPTPEQKKEYDGEFYPTVAHAKKKTE